MKFYLLKEDGDYLLKEDGDKILLESTFDRGGVITTWRHREYLFDLFAAVFKKNSGVIKSYTPVKFNRDQVIMLSSTIQKEKVLDFKIMSPINSEKLRKILNAL